MKILKFCSIFLFCLSFSAYGITPRLKKELDNELSAIAEEHSIPAMSVAIVSSGENFYTGGVGLQAAEKATPVTSNTLFRIASITKLFTAQAIMQLVEKSSLKLNDKISLHLPEFEHTDITIKQLLTHSSGIMDQIRPVPPEDKRSISDYLTSVNANLERGESSGTFNYSDTGFNLLGAIVSEVSQMPFEDYVEQNILTPTNMNRSGFFDGREGAIAEVEPTYEGSVIREDKRRPYDAAFFPSEGLLSNAQELGQWAISNLAMNENILSKQSYRQMYVPQVKTNWGDISIGLGWQVYKVMQRTVARHPGSIRGFKSLIVTYPENGNAIILLTNASEAPRFEIEARITELLRNEGIWD